MSTSFADIKPTPARAAAQQSVSPEEWRARVDLAAAHRLADLKGWQEDYWIFNHFASRVPGEPASFLIKPHHLMFSEVCASSLLKVGIDSGPKRTIEDNINGAGFAIHSSIFRARPDVNVSLHLHSQVGMALSAMKGGLRFFTQEGMRFHNRIGYHDFEGIAEVDEGPRIVRDLGNNDTLIMRNHGVLCCGPAIDYALLNLGRLLRIADVQLRVMASGDELIEPSPEIREQTALHSLRSSNGPAEWDAILRYLDRCSPGYRD